MSKTGHSNWYRKNATIVEILQNSQPCHRTDEVERDFRQEGELSVKIKSKFTITSF
jgi:hypothetical protein